MQTGVNLDRRVCRRKQVGKHPVCRHAPMVQETSGRQYERSGTNRRHPPRPRRYRTHPLNKRLVFACLFDAVAPRDD